MNRDIGVQPHGMLVFAAYQGTGYFIPDVLFWIVVYVAYSHIHLSFGKKL